MQAIQYDRYGDPDVLTLVEIATPEPGPGEARVRVAAIGVNPADPKWRQGMFANVAPQTLPCVPGYDIAGVVDAVGAGVTQVSVGDRVAAMLNNRIHGAYAQYAVLPAADVSPMPQDMDFDQAAAVPCAGLTGAQMIEAHIHPSAGQTVLVTGALGAVGRFGMRSALIAGARVVAAVRPGLEDEARALGAAQVIVLDEADWSGDPFDHVADTVGGPAVARLCRHVAPGGWIGTVATTPIDPQGLPSTPRFIAVHVDAPMLTRLLSEVNAGLIPLPIAGRLPLARAAEAHRAMEAGGVGGKLILVP